MRTTRHSWAVTISAILLSLTVKSVCSAELMGLDNVTFGNFNFQFVDRVNDTGIGFDDPMIATNGMTVGDNRVALLGEVAAHLSDVLNVTGTANVEIRASLDDETSTALASGGSAFFFASGFQQGLVQQGLLGTNNNAGQGFAQFNFGTNFNETLDAPAANEIDFFSVALHELTHAIGAISLISPEGSSEIVGPQNQNVFSTFDQFLQQSDGTALITDGQLTAAADLDGDEVADVLQSEQLVFVGENAVAANNGMPVEIFAPAVFLPGSSLSHIVEADAVLQFSIAPGVARRDFTAVEIGILQDIGFVDALSTAVPEPTSLAMFGIAVLVITPFRRRFKQRKSRISRAA